MEIAHMDEADVSRQRSTQLIGILIAGPISIAIWFGVDRLMPPLTGLDDPVSRLIFALKCCCVAVLLCFFTGIEAVAHERLVSPAIDPLAGYETRRMRVNLRYLQNTLEQLLLFIPGLLALTAYCPDGSAMRAIGATTVVWIVSRGTFWIAYHFGPQYRGVGLTGMVQSALVLLYVSARFGYECAGVPGAVAPLVVLGGIEAYLVFVTRPHPK